MLGLKNKMTYLNTLRSGEAALKYRICIYILTLVHLVFMSLRLLNIDFESSDDPILRQYSKIKWKLLTAWFNLITIAFLTIGIYCGWEELKGNKQSKHVKILNRTNKFLFNSIIFPSTAFGDILFWRIWNQNRTLMMPLSVDKYITVWDQHSMHTISLIFILYELIFVHRKKPKTFAFELVAMTVYVSAYVVTCFVSLLNEEYVYPCFKLFSHNKLVILVIYTYISHLFYYTAMWVVVDLFNYQSNISKKVA